MSTPPTAIGRDPDRLPDTSDPSGPCPRCGRPSNFGLHATFPLTYKVGIVAVTHEGRSQRVPAQQVAVLECAYCQQNIVVIETVGNGPGGHGFHWWPTPGGGTMGPEVHEGVSQAYGEGVRCMSANAPNGAAAMFRTALAYLVEDKGSEQAKSKRDLKDKIRQLAKDGGLPSSLVDWANHVRLYGNAAAHPDVYGEVSIQEAQEIANLIKTLVEVIYVLPAIIAARQASRLPPGH
jgi:Domain of unknown function (DUF4145)